MRRKKNTLISVLTVLLPLIAFASAGTATFLWHRAHPRSDAPEKTERSEKVRRVKAIRPVAPEKFSAALGENLAAFLADYGVGKKQFREAKPDSFGAEIKTVYVANIPSAMSLTLLHLNIRDWVGAQGGEVLDAVESADGLTLTLTLGARSTATDVLKLQKTSGVEVKEAVMAVIVEDLGVQDIESARRLSRIGQTVTFSILPFQRYTGKVVDIAVKSETPFILHMPMESKSSAEKPGEGAILTGDSDETITRKLDRAFGSVRGASGLSNHMGSRAIRDLRTMETVMRYVQGETGFFVDSRNAGQSVMSAVSQEVKVRCATVTGSLDDIEERGAIRNRLRELARTALEGKPVIVTGRDRPATVDVLEQELPALAKKGIRFVSVEELAK